MSQNLYLVVGIMSVDGVFLEDIFDDTKRDATLENAKIQLCPHERATLELIIRNGGDRLKNKLAKNGEDYFCPDWPNCPWPKWPVPAVGGVGGATS